MIEQEILEKLTNIENRLQNNLLESEWYNDEQCWKLKGGLALSTYRHDSYYQIKGGIEDARVGGRKVWSRNSVIEWLTITDDQLPEYHKKYKTGAVKKNANKFV